MHQNSTPHRVLAFLATQDKPRCVRDIATASEATYSGAAVALTDMLLRGLVTKPHRGEYQITEKGNQQLELMLILADGEIDLAADVAARDILDHFDITGVETATLEEIAAGPCVESTEPELRAAARRLAVAKMLRVTRRHVSITHRGREAIKDYDASQGSRA